jgi:hypothetical protein
MEERWPPVYDAEDLRRVIAEISGTQGLAKKLYANPPAGTYQSFFQGDIVEFEAQIPLLDSTAAPATGEGIHNWMVLGNSCDLDRSFEEVPFTQLLPVRRLVGATAQRIDVLAGYRVSRQFYLPDWSNNNRCMYADYLCPVTIERKGLTEHAKIVARMSHLGWMLLHACTVRFLCRDDGRFA